MRPKCPDIPLAVIFEQLLRKVEARVWGGLYGGGHSAGIFRAFVRAARHAPGMHCGGVCCTFQEGGGEGEG